MSDPSASSSRCTRAFSIGGAWWHYNMRRDYDPSTGRYLEADPIGLAGGLNLYAYAANDPTNASDPSGLVTYSGTAWSFAGIGGVGATFSIYFLESECVNARKVRLTVFASGLSAGLGVRYTGAGAPATFDDAKPQIDLETFNGGFGSANAGITFTVLPVRPPGMSLLGVGPGLGAALSVTQLGDAFSGWPPSPSPQVGNDRSISITGGFSAVIDYEFLPCCEEAP